ncbi:uncharacterized protein MICPUCDRAFT_38373 [Micromonas pusilla CCMP1545]|uniref:Predicted protein n=2 Tax=Micromonas pusilla TaxID=38833 RepID=C1MJU6_MICPC|nr:uncharacterized protein MICPUCDRAFT_38373 [Micromonas pusilla CCMP1545]EEH59649.1 predicted protein [Micromonas pusilla CCMP1545]|eukprot:XP_003056273.1 predicted protein [Micromonas pusilla CCMP1545]
MPPPRRPARTPARTPASSSSSSSETHRVHEIATLGRADDATARRLLERCAWHVQPIMRARRWRVATLLEMKPEQRDRVGDNYNRGERVRIKLRNPASDTGWYDLGHVVLVMLHELVHNDIGPHNRAFFKLLDEITAECEDLTARGVGGTGVGFDAPGAKLGHRGGWGGLETRSAKDAAKDAAERRARASAVMGPPGGRRLGGGETTEEIRKPAAAAAAAAAAAERRARGEDFAQRWGLLDDVVVLSDDDDDDVVCGDAPPPPPPPRARKVLKDRRSPRRRGRTGTSANGVENGRGVARTCPCCAAALDALDARAADAHARTCEEMAEGAKGEGVKTEKKRDRGAAATGDDVIVIDDDDDDDDDGRRRGRGRAAAAAAWRCRACTLDNPADASNCRACETWRFSRGAPAASRPTIG